MYKYMKAALILLSSVLFSGCAASGTGLETVGAADTVTAFSSDTVVSMESAADGQISAVTELSSGTDSDSVQVSAVTELEGTDNSGTDSLSIVEVTAVDDTSDEQPEKTEKLKKDTLSGHKFSASEFPGKVYSNKKLKKALDEIDKICSDYGWNISFVYKNMKTGATCAYNENKYYGCCSTIKAPYCKSILESGIDLDEKITINDLWYPCCGKVADAGYGSLFTARELITLAITESDNSAYLNLVNKYGFEDFNDLNSKLGANFYLGYGYIFNECTASDLAKEYADIYKYGERAEHGDWLISLMQKTELETQITAELSDKYPVSHKYGSDWDQMCYHDCAICYADSPFVLIIMTNQEPETEKSDKVFRKLAKQFDIVNEQLAEDEKKK